MGGGVPSSCPVCGGPVYDNREKKAAGVYKPTAPDAKCSIRTCNWKQWPEKDDSMVTARATPHNVPSKSLNAPEPYIPSGWEDACALYGRAQHEAAKILGASADPTTLAMVTAGLAMVAAFKGIRAIEPKARPAQGVGPAFDNPPLPPEPEDDLPFG